MGCMGCMGVWGIEILFFIIIIIVSSIIIIIILVEVGKVRVSKLLTVEVVCWWSWPRGK